MYYLRCLKIWPKRMTTLYFTMVASGEGQTREVITSKKVLSSGIIESTKKTQKMLVGLPVRKFLHITCNFPSLVGNPGKVCFWYLQDHSGCEHMSHAEQNWLSSLGPFQETVGILVVISEVLRGFFSTIWGRTLQRQSGSKIHMMVLGFPRTKTKATVFGGQTHSSYVLWLF